jgi:hypothetical protein
MFSGSTGPSDHSKLSGQTGGFVAGCLAAIAEAGEERFRFDHYAHQQEYLKTRFFGILNNTRTTHRPAAFILDEIEERWVL